MCCMWERREVASFSAVFVQGIMNSFPSMKGLYSKKGAEQGPTRTKCLQWPPVCPLTVTSHSRTLVPLIPAQSTPEFLCNQSRRNWKCTSQGRIWPPDRWKFSLSLNARWDGHCKHRPCFREPGQTLGRVWQCWAPVLGITCTWGMCGTHRDSSAYQDRLKENGELNKAQSPEIWTDKEGCVSLEINFHQKAPPNDWQLHPRT